MNFSPRSPHRRSLARTLLIVVTAVFGAVSSFAQSDPPKKNEKEKEKKDELDARLAKIAEAEAKLKSLKTGRE